MEAAELLEVQERLIARALAGADDGRLLREPCERLCARGIPLWRVMAGTEELHPLVEGHSAIWKRGGVAQAREMFTLDSARRT